MRLWRRRTRPVPSPPRPDRTRIAVLEYDLFGVQPKPGTLAAAVIGLRRVVSCTEHAPVETTTLGDAHRAGAWLCSQCGHVLVLDEAGRWVTASTSDDPDPQS